MALDKLGRNYQLLVQTQNDSTLTIGLPFTIEFDITRNTLTSANVCQVRIYNLSELNRNQIRFNISDYGHFRAIKLKAGYGNNIPVIFEGNISQAWSVREGVDFITQIECYDGGFAFTNGKTNVQFPAGVPQQQVVQQLILSLPHIKSGAISSTLFPGILSRGNSYSGNTSDILRELTGGAFFVDKQKANILGTNEYILGAPTLINTKTGLIGTPVLERTIARFDMIFEPTLNCGELVVVNGLTEKNFNGQYKITGIKHRGMISDAVCGKVITTGEFFYSKVLTGIPQLQ